MPHLMRRITTPPPHRQVVRMQEQVENGIRLELLRNELVTLEARLPRGKGG
jgi:hypothetical protein